MADSKKYNGSTWEHSLRKLTTATVDIEPTIYTDGTAITAYTLKGNTVQSGTPTPSAPISVNGVGERTKNIYNKTNIITITIGDRYGVYVPTGTYSIYNDTDNIVYWFANNGSTILEACQPHSTSTVTLYGDTTGLYMPYNSASLGDITIVQGTTVPDHYIPYGYKIPILSNQTALTPVYLTEQLMKIGDTVDSLASAGTISRVLYRYEFTGNEIWTEDTRMVYLSKNYLGDIPAPLANSALICSHFPNNNVNGMVNGGAWVFQTYGYTAVASDLTTWKQWLADQYAAGTPVTVYFVLETPTTETVTAPSIPTTEGANSITVDTTVQPSEFTATWTGWHNAEVKEKSENLFDEFDIVGQVPSISNGQLINYNGSTTSLIPIISGNITVTKPPTALLYLLLYAADMSYIGYVQNSTDANFYGSSVTGYENAKYCRLRIDRTTGLDDIQIMLNSGSTALPYEPYWK